MKLGLCLAGGGSLGAYQVGVLKRLYEKGYEFDIVTGTSVGALNGSFVSMGDIAQLEKLWLEITPEKVMKDGINLNKDVIINFNDENLLGFLKTYAFNKGADITPFKELCSKYIIPSKIKQSKVSFGSVCVAFPSMKEVKVNMQEIDDDLVLPFIHASSACVPVFPIETIQDKKYIDGFYKNNLPIDYCFELGADKVLAIDMSMFGLAAQNAYLTKLPNVDVIKSHVDLGSFMDFSQEIIRKNIRRGYNDCKKYLKEYRGYRFTFYKDDDFAQYGDQFVKLIISNTDLETKSLLKFLIDDKRNKDFPITDNTSLLILALEAVGEVLKIDDSVVYHHKDFFELVTKKMDDTPTDGIKSLIFTSKNRISKFYKKIMNQEEDYQLNKIEMNDDIINVFYLLVKLYKSFN